jgi:uncharacterized OB-fold protein
VLDYELPDRGTLWSWTVQRFEPKPPYRGPQEFVPYGVGYVELAGQCIVEARLTSLGPWSIGDPVSLTSVEAFNDELGAPVRTYAYEPEGAR